MHGLLPITGSTGEVPPDGTPVKLALWAPSDGPCAPPWCPIGVSWQVLGVVQMINKQGGFTIADSDLLRSLVAKVPAQPSSTAVCDPSQQCAWVAGHAYTGHALLP